MDICEYSTAYVRLIVINVTSLKKKGISVHFVIHRMTLHHYSMVAAWSAQTAIAWQR